MPVLFVLLVLQPIAVRAYLPASFSPGISFDSEQGLLIERSKLENGEAIEYERPVVLLPPHLVPGELHTSQRRFVLRAGDEKRDVGAHYFEAELLRLDDLEGFPGCLVVRRREVRMDFSGGKETVDVTEWYAKGSGLVRAVGERVETGEDGSVVGRTDIALEPS